MRINIKNQESWQAIKSIQGRAQIHSFYYIEWDSMGGTAEKALKALNIPLSLRQGAIVKIRSGGRIPMAYKWQRSVTSVTLQRGKTDWFLIACQKSETGDRKAGGTFTMLKKCQAEYLVNKLKSSFGVQS